MMTVYGERVSLRPVEPGDFAAIEGWQDPESAEYYDIYGPATLEEWPTWRRRLQSDRHKRSFAICTTDGRLIGLIELDHIAWRSGDAELRVLIGDPLYRGRGLGTDAIGALMQHAFTSLNLSRIYLRVFEENRAAIRCYQKSGFRKEGRLTRVGPDGQKRAILLMTIEKEAFLSRSA